MSEYANYLKNDVEALYGNGYEKGFKNGRDIGLVIGAILCALTALVCYRQFGPPSKVPNLSLLIGDIQRVKDDTEGIAYSIKSRWRSRIISEGDCRDGANRYRQVVSSFNGVEATLEAMLSTGHDDSSMISIKASLSVAEQHYNSLQSWFSGLPKEIPKPRPIQSRRADEPFVIGAAPEGVLPDVTELGLDLVKHFYDGMKEMDKLKRDHLIGMLQNLRFKAWSEIP